VLDVWTPKELPPSVVLRIVPSSPTTHATLVLGAKVTALRSRDVPVDRLCHSPSPTKRRHVPSSPTASMSGEPFVRLMPARATPSRCLPVPEFWPPLHPSPLHAIVPSSPTAM
jgi:hypothetical protein